MRQNLNTCVRGKEVVLLPYKKEMVPKYHDWMKSPELLQLTASEPLTLEEEYEMQRKWSEDDDKCTFIVLDKDLYDQTGEEIGSMIGDTNLFFNGIDEHDSRRTAEAEIMIAEPWARKKHKGWDAIILMFLYVKRLKVLLHLNWPVLLAPQPGSFEEVHGFR